MPYSAAHGADVLVTPRVERAGCVIAVVRGELDIASAPDLREELLGLLRPGASRLIIDLSAVGYADTSGVAVLVGTGRRARLLGGWLRLVSPAPEVTRVLSVTGLNRHLATFPTVEEAITGRRPDTSMGTRGPASPDAGHASGLCAQPSRALGAAPRAVNSARRSAPSSRTPTPGATPTPAPGSPPPFTYWRWPTPAPAGDGQPGGDDRSDAPGPARVPAGPVITAAADGGQACRAEQACGRR
jgi:anti-anti-sigma factor